MLLIFFSLQTTEAQITLEQQKERREQHIRRLKEINAKRRLDKVKNLFFITTICFILFFSSIYFLSIQKAQFKYGYFFHMMLINSHYIQFLACCNLDLVCEKFGCLIFLSQATLKYQLRFSETRNQDSLHHHYYHLLSIFLYSYALDGLTGSKPQNYIGFQCQFWLGFYG